MRGKSPWLEIPWEEIAFSAEPVKSISLTNIGNTKTDWVTIEGGMSRLVRAAANMIGSQNIHLNLPIKAIRELDNGRISLSADEMPACKWIFDKVILALPLSSLQGILNRPRWSVKKEQAIRGTYFEPLYKMGLHFKTRFWEQGDSPNFGGQSVTDLRVRRVIYPSNDLGSQGSGVLVLYAWMTDAARWSALPMKDRVDVALHELGLMHPRESCGHDVKEEFLEAFDINWAAHPSTGSCMYLPGQFTRFHQIGAQPEGSIYFAGEHGSKHHAWLTGALESAYTTVKQLLDNNNLMPLDATVNSQNGKQRESQVDLSL